MRLNFLARQTFSGQAEHKNPPRTHSMDARNHLRGLGWKGEGHSLGKNANGLKKPLLIKHKTGLHGLGAKSQKEKQADQWWLNAFDNALKDMGSGKESSLSKIRDSGAGRGGLYGYFVRGQVLESTFDENGESTGTNTPTDVHVTNSTTVVLSVRDLNEVVDERRSKEEKRRRREDKRLRKEQKQGKKREREEDLIDSHQGQLETTEPARTKKSKKQKRVHAMEPQIEPSDAQEAGVQREDNSPGKTLSAAEQLMAQKSEKRKTKEEKRVLKEDKRQKKASDSTMADEEKRKDSKRRKKRSTDRQEVK